MGRRFWKPSSANTTNEREDVSTSLALKTLSATTDSSLCNSGWTSGQGTPSRRASTDLGGQEQAALATTTPRPGENEPYHVFGHQMKWVIIAQIGVAGMFSGLSSNIYFPCLKSITKVNQDNTTPPSYSVARLPGWNVFAKCSQEFATSHQVASLTITSYQLIQGVAPLIWGTLSDKLGRRQAYVYSFAVYVAANAVLAYSPSLSILFAFRGLQAFGSASVVSIGNGVIQDIALPAERGSFMSIYQALRMCSIAVGPVIGGALSHKWGFRSIFAALAVLSVLVLIQIVIFLPETLRSVAGNGSVRLKGIRYKPVWNVTSQKQNTLADHQEVFRQKIKLRDFWEPLRMLGEMDTLLNLLFGAVVYSVWSMMTCTTTMLFAERFGLNELHIGIAYLPNGIGTCAGSALSGWQMDRDYKSAEAIYKAAHGMSGESRISPKTIPSDFPIEKARFRHVFLITGLLAASLALYGAAFLGLPITSRHEWMAVPLVLQFFIAGASNMIFAINSTLITDLHPGKGAGATAINNLARCTMSAGAVPLVHHMIKKLGTAWTFCVLAVVLILCMPLAIVSRIRGMEWRAERMKRAEDLERGTLRATGV